IRLNRVSASADIMENRFSSPRQKQMVALEHVHILNCAGRITVSNNTFSNAATQGPASAPGGIFVSGTRGSVYVDGNQFDHCGRDDTGKHAVGVVEFHGNSENVTVNRNVSTNTLATFLHLRDSYPVDVVDNTVELSTAAESANAIMVE